MPLLDNGGSTYLHLKMSELKSRGINRFTAHICRWEGNTILCTFFPGKEEIKMTTHENELLTYLATHNGKLLRAAITSLFAESYSKNQKIQILEEAVKGLIEKEILDPVSLRGPIIQVLPKERRVL